MMKLNVLTKALALTIVSATSVSAATFSVDFASLVGNYSSPLVVNSFLTIDSDTANGNMIFVEATDLFGGPNPGISAAGGPPISFLFDTTKVNVTSLTLNGRSNNVPVTIDVFGSTNLSVDTSSAWSEITTITGSSAIYQVDVRLLESSISGFQFEYTPVSAVPVPAAVWLFASGLIGLAGVARNKKAA